MMQFNPSTKTDQFHLVRDDRFATVLRVSRCDRGLEPHSSASTGGIRLSSIDSFAVARRVQNGSPHCARGTSRLRNEHRYSR